MSTNPANFVAVSFGGLIPEYWYDPTSGGTQQVVIGTTNIKWKLEIDLADDNKLKFYFSDDNGATYTQKMAISPL